MTKVAALLLASLGVVTAAFLLWEVGGALGGADRVASPNIGQVLMPLAMVAAWSGPAFLAAVAFGRRPGSPAARGFAVLVALGYLALGLFGAWAGWATRGNFTEGAYDQWTMLAVVGAVLAVLSVATLGALGLAMKASRSVKAGDGGSDR